MLTAGELRAVDPTVRDLLQRRLGQPVESIECTANPYSATFPSELIHCRLRDGTRRSFIGKRGPAGNAIDGCRYGGLEYEARVYERVLVPEIGASESPFVGAARDDADRHVTLVLEYLSDHERVDRASDMPLAMRRATRWLGEFHSRTDRLIAAGQRFPLARFNTRYYERWPRRLRRFVGRSADHAWLAPLLDRYGVIIELLSGEPPTVIHGDFYADNVLVRGNEVVVIDWSWSAMAVGEIDLASITAGWPDEYVVACEQEYRVARGSDRPVETCRRVLDAARVHLHCRWLAHRRTWPREPRQQWRFTSIRQAAERLGVI